jgi:predicted phosphodiesterase
MEKLIQEFLLERKGYLKKSNRVILERLGYSNPTKKKETICGKIKKEIINALKTENKKVKVRYSKGTNKFNPDNVLVIGDLHEPFCLPEYLEFCKQKQHQEDCGTVIFIGDIIDNHYSSYHETDPDGYSAGEELDRAINKIQTWYEAFPEAYVILGNHDRLVYRKAQTCGLSKRWIREYNEVLETPNWEFLEEITINGVCYNHGEGGTARTRMKNEMQSQVQGHLHAQFYLEYNVSPVNRIFGMQVGCGVDRASFAMAYGKRFKRPIIGCATVSGKHPVPRLHPMDL